MTVCTIIINFELTYACFLSNNGFEILYREEVTHLLASTTNHKSVILFLANYSSASFFGIIKFYLFNLINGKFRFDYKCDLKIFQIILLHSSFIHPLDPTRSTSPIFEIFRNWSSFSTLMNTTERRSSPCCLDVGISHVVSGVADYGWIPWSL